MEHGPDMHRARPGRPVRKRRSAWLYSGHRPENTHQALALLSFILPGTDLSFSLQGTILNSNYEPEFHEDRNVLGTYSGIDIQFLSLSSSDESKIRAWVLQNLPRASDLS